MIGRERTAVTRSVRRGKLFTHKHFANVNRHTQAMCFFFVLPLSLCCSYTRCEFICPIVKLCHLYVAGHWTSSSVKDSIEDMTASVPGWWAHCPLLTHMNHNILYLACSYQHNSVHFHIACQWSLTVDYRFYGLKLDAFPLSGDEDSIPEYMASILKASYFSMVYWPSHNLMCIPPPTVRDGNRIPKNATRYKNKRPN